MLHPKSPDDSCPSAQLATQGDELTQRVDVLGTDLEEMTEKIYELDKSWKNNLVFYGVREDGADEHPAVTESKVRDVIRRTMRIHREIAILRVKRAANGPNVRGSKPITVYFDKWEVR